MLNFTFKPISKESNHVLFHALLKCRFVGDCYFILNCMTNSSPNQIQGSGGKYGSLGVMPANRHKIYLDMLV